MDDMDKVEKEKLYSPFQNTRCRGYPVKLKESGEKKRNLFFLHNTVREIGWARGRSQVGN